MTSRHRTGRQQARRRRLAATGIVALSTLVASGCAPKSDPLQIGFRRVSLDLVFKDATKAEPLEPQRVIQTIEFVDEEFPAFRQELEPELEEQLPQRPRRPPPPPANVAPPCIPAPEGVAPDQPVFAAVKDPPKEGSYRRANSGTIGLELPSPLPSGKFPYPPRTTWEITDVGRHSGTVATNPTDDEALGVGSLPSNPAVPQVVRFTVTRNVGRTLKTIDTYQYYLDREPADLDNTNNDGDGIYLVRRDTRSSTFGTSVFTPTPPVMIVPISVETEAARDNVSAGIDRESDAALSVTSRVVGREAIDVCGEVVDTYRVQWEEQFTSLSPDAPQASGNAEAQKPNIWNIAYSKNLLLVREEMHTVNRVMTSGTPPVPVVVTYDYVSTLNNTEPEPIKTAAAATPTSPADDEEEEEE